MRRDGHGALAARAMSTRPQERRSEWLVGTPREGRAPFRRAPGGEGGWLFSRVSPASRRLRVGVKPHLSLRFVPLVWLAAFVACAAWWLGVSLLLVGYLR